MRQWAVSQHNRQEWKCLRTNKWKEMSASLSQTTKGGETSQMTLGLTKLEAIGTPNLNI